MGTECKLSYKLYVCTVKASYRMCKVCEVLYLNYQDINEPQLSRIALGNTAIECVSLEDPVKGIHYIH